ncbi:hypothetical protein CATMQ487_07690 [Sphaerotilus microaerophilus]|uniref:Uncharacterized protein n=1 Tax=Sphaerotilus microaerophilus TaxID=2914710 RepID=A0ABN6PIG2_9BURK|nr:hypothetical protein CATMQ487_07690 [Sphaerotilus sp. FB-5]
MWGKSTHSRQGRVAGRVGGNLTGRAVVAARGGSQRITSRAGSDSAPADGAAAPSCAAATRPAGASPRPNPSASSTAGVDRERNRLEITPGLSPDRRLRPSPSELNRPDPA